MAARPNFHRLPDHGRDAKCVRRAAGKPFCAARQTDDEGGRGSREGVRDVDLTVADAEQVVMVQGGERLVNGGRGSIAEGRGDVLHGDRPAAIQEGPKHLFGNLRLPPGTPGAPPVLPVERHQLVCGLDRQGRHYWPSSLLPAAMIKSLATTHTRSIAMAR